MEKTKKENVMGRMIAIVQENQMKSGDRLPSEREMAETFKTSRATVREVLRSIEEKGLLKVVRGSGAYLNCDFTEFKNVLQASCQKTVSQTIREYFEVHAVFVANMARVAALEADEKKLEDMRKTTVKMSVALIDRNYEKFVFQENRFFMILAEMSKNFLFLKLMGLVIKQHRFVWDEVVKEKLFPNETFFAGYVNIYNALRAGNPSIACLKVQESIFDVLDLLVDKVDPSFKGTKDYLKSVLEVEIEH